MEGVSTSALYFLVYIRNIVPLDLHHGLHIISPVLKSQHEIYTPFIFHVTIKKIKGEFYLKQGSISYCEDLIVWELTEIPTRNNLGKTPCEILWRTLGVFTCAPGVGHGGVLIESVLCIQRLMLQNGSAGALTETHSASFS